VKRIGINSVKFNYVRVFLRHFLLAFVLVFPVFANGQFNHDDWDILLKKHVRVIDGGKASQVDYAGMAEDKASLDAYLGDVASVRKQTFDEWTTDEQLAFLINTYNAATVSLVLTEYPQLDSIRDLGSLFRSPWSRAFVSLFGEMVTLDNIEHDMIRGWNIYNEPRIHFAVNCAAIGCPPLRAEAYIGATLTQQLDDSARLFLSDRSRNYFDGKRVYVSKIFDWYVDDFEQGWQGMDSLGEFLAGYADALGLDTAQTQALRAGDISIRYLSYDWGLNKTR